MSVPLYPEIRARRKRAATPPYPTATGEECRATAPASLATSAIAHATTKDEVTFFTVNGVSSANYLKKRPRGVTGYRQRIG